MPRELTLAPALSETDARGLRAGDAVRISGELITARDAACLRITEALRAGGPLPVPLEGRVVYAVGPTPPKPGQVIGSAGPTTAARLLPYLDALLGAGVRGLIGKGDWPPAGAEIFRRQQAVYFAAVGGAAALIAKTVTAVEVVAYEDLGPEAVYRLRVEGFPAVVALDVHGNDLHDAARRRWRRLP